MIKFFNRTTLLILSLLLGTVCFAQDKIAQDKIEMADMMRSNGKIYVVVTVCLVILIGLFLYVMSLDRKLRKMEKEK